MLSQRLRGQLLDSCGQRLNLLGLSCVAGCEFRDLSMEYKNVYSHTVDVCCHSSLQLKNDVFYIIVNIIVGRTLSWRNRAVLANWCS